MNKPVLEIGNGNWGVKNKSVLGYVEGDELDGVMPRPITWERGSDNLTRVNKDGFIEKGRRNLLHYSNDFSRWIPPQGEYGYEVDHGYTGYDGSNDAWLINKTTSGIGNNQYLYSNNNTVNTGTNDKWWCFSVYAKAAGPDSVLHMYIGDSGNDNKGNVYIELNTGSVIAKGGYVTASQVTVDSVGNDGWYRVSYTNNSNLNDRPRLQVRNRNRTQGSAGRMYIMHSQLEYGTAPSEYINSGSPTNLFRDSFDIQSSAWFTSGAPLVITPNQLGYDGTYNAFKVNKTAGEEQYHHFNQYLPGDGVVGEHVVSIYAKAGNRDGIVIRLNNNGVAAGAEIHVNLREADLRSTSSRNYRVTPVKDGWVRVELFADVPFDRVVFYPADGRKFISGEGTGAGGQAGFIYVQHPQLEKGSIATEYKETREVSGVELDKARIDYTGGEGHILLEPARANDVKYSENLSGWFSDTVNIDDEDIRVGYITPNGGIAPDGTKSATLFTENTGTVLRSIHKQFLYSQGVFYSWSFYLKPNGVDAVKFFRGTDWVANIDVTFFLTPQGLISGPQNNGDGTATISDAGDGWYKCTIEGVEGLRLNTDPAVTYSSTGMSFMPVKPDGSGGYTSEYSGDNTSGFLVWGLQREVGRFATSYMPNYGDASVSRTIDYSYTHLDEYFDGKDFTFFVDFNENKSLYRDTDTANIRLGETDSQAGAFRIYRNQNASVFTHVLFSPTSGSDAAVSFTGTKLALRRDYATNTFSMFVDGAEVTDGAVPYTNAGFGLMQELLIRGSGSTQKISGIKLFNEALTDAELIELTS